MLEVSPGIFGSSRSVVISYIISSQFTLSAFEIYTVSLNFYIVQSLGSLGIFL